VYVAAVECTAYLLVELRSSKKAAVVKVLPLASERREDCCSFFPTEHGAACNSILTKSGLQLDPD